MEVLGGDYRFETRFYLDDKRKLYVRGGGDPFLISEELAPLATELVAEQLAAALPSTGSSTYCWRLPIMLSVIPATALPPVGRASQGSRSPARGILALFRGHGMSRDRYSRLAGEVGIGAVAGLDRLPRSGGVGSERHAAARMVIPSMPALASAGVR